MRNVAYVFVAALIAAGCSDAADSDADDVALDCDREAVAVSVGDVVDLGKDLQVAIPDGSIDSEGTLGTRCLTDTERAALVAHDERYEPVSEPFVFVSQGFEVLPPLYGIIFTFDTVETASEGVEVAYFSTAEDVTDYEALRSGSMSDRMSKVEVSQDSQSILRLERRFRW